VCDNKEKEKLFNKFNKLIKKEKKETTIWIDLEYGTWDIELMHLCYDINKKKIIFVLTPKLWKSKKTIKR
jgi:hypothetical protein